MPHKYNADRRHRFPKTRYKVTNWKAYEAGLRQRGSLTIWFSEEGGEHKNLWGDVAGAAEGR
jgi:hypothetical protein